MELAILASILMVKIFIKFVHRNISTISTIINVKLDLTILKSWQVKLRLTFSFKVLLLQRLASAWPSTFCFIQLFSSLPASIFLFFIIKHSCFINTGLVPLQIVWPYLINYYPKLWKICFKDERFQWLWIILTLIILC